MRIGIVAPSTPVTQASAERVAALAAAQFPAVELFFHPQCFLVHRHFAGDDAARAAAFLEVANDSGFDALWFARGGYGSCRIADGVLERLGPAGRTKTYMGYSDAGFLLAGLHKAGFAAAHGPMPNDIVRERGEEAVLRALAWLTDRSAEALEPGLGAAPAAAFNLTVLSQLLGTPLQPELDGYELLIEEVSEHLYRIDRSLFHVTANPNIRRVAGIRIGRCSLIPENDPDFGESQEEIVQFWCARSGIPFLGTADIGHDAQNRIVPFGNPR